MARSVQDDMPMTLKIDLHLAVLSSMSVQEQGGWSIPRLAEFIGCSEAAVVARQQAALSKLRAALASDPATLAQLAGLPEAARLAGHQSHEPEN